MQPKATESAAKRSPKAYLKGVLAVTRIVYAALDRLEEPPPRQSHKDEEKKRSADANNWTLVGRETHRVQPKLRRRNQIRKVRMPSFQTKIRFGCRLSLQRSVKEAFPSTQGSNGVEAEIIHMVAISMSQDMDLILKQSQVDKKKHEEELTFYREQTEEAYKKNVDLHHAIKDALVYHYDYGYTEP